MCMRAKISFMYVHVYVIYVVTWLLRFFLATRKWPGSKTKCVRMYIYLVVKFNAT